jgi:hypothetical protein
VGRTFAGRFLTVVVIRVSDDHYHVITGWPSHWSRELKRPFVLEAPTKQVSLRMSVLDLELPRRLARRKGIPKYQTYIKTLLHEMLVKEAEDEK